jgi:hypothetical protein
VLALLEALLPLLLALAKVLFNLLRRRVLDKLTLLVKSGPLGQTVRNIDAALAVEHVESARRKSQYQESLSKILSGQTYLGAKFLLS